MEKQDEGQDSEAAPALSITVVSIDHYMAPPLPALDVDFSASLNVALKQVPVLRIFGASTLGDLKTCLHLHRVFPYLLVPTHNSWPTQPCARLQTHALTLAKSLEHALRDHDRLQKEERQGAGGGVQVRQERQHVLKAQIVRAVPFYGTHLSERLFVKLFLLDPGDLPKAAGLLQGGACMGTHFQPFNAHIPYVLQAMADLNLVGMGSIDLSSVTFRAPQLRSPPGNRRGCEVSTAVPDHILAMLARRWQAALLARPAMVSNGHQRMSVCDLECDALLSDVLNVQRVKTVRLTQDNRGIKMVETLGSCAVLILVCTCARLVVAT